MIDTLTIGEYKKYLIVRADTGEDYEVSGKLALVFPDGTAAVYKFGHCSCFDTDEDMAEKDYRSSQPDVKVKPPDWSGTVEELVRIATVGEDFMMPGRVLADDDYDYAVAAEFNRKIVEWSLRSNP